MVDVNEIIPHEKNPNKHSKEQVKRLAKIIKTSGFRNPLIVSKLSGRLIAGHGRLLAARQIGLKELPVIFQDFESEDEEFQHLVADNATNSSWDGLDLAAINAQLPTLGPDFDIDLLGLKSFVLEPAEKEKKPKQPRFHECPECGHEWAD